jgi:hypothetical protein
MAWTEKEFADLCEKAGVKPEDALKAGKLDLSPEHKASNSLAQSKNVKKRHATTKRIKKGYDTRLALGIPITEPKPNSPLALEQAARRAPPRDEKPDSRIVVRITSYRRRFLDFDNLVGGLKSCVDCLQLSGLIPDDGYDAIKLEPTQERVIGKNQEKTRIEIEYPEA